MTGEGGEAGLTGWILSESIIFADFLREESRETAPPDTTGIRNIEIRWLYQESVYLPVVSIEYHHLLFADEHNARA
jgi:hypothetical protein